MTSYDSILKKADSLDPVSRELLLGIFAELQRVIFELPGSDAQRLRRLEQIHQYLKKKKETISASKVQDKPAYLRAVRNSIVHRQALPEDAYGKAVPILWSLLKKSAPDWKADRLGRFLAYSLGRREVFLPESDDAEAVVRYYKNVFDKLPIDERMERFRGLLMGVFASEEMGSTLQRLEKRRAAT